MSRSASGEPASSSTELAELAGEPAQVGARLASRRRTASVKSFDSRRSFSTLDAK
jgi:hypothetical protein